MQALEQLLTILTPVLLALAGWVAVRVETRVKRMTHVELESYHREALHLALGTGVKLAIAKLVRDGKSVNTHIEDIKAQGVAYARQSVPDAIAYLNAQFERLLDLAESKVSENVPFIELNGPELESANIVFDGEEATTVYGSPISPDQLELALKSARSRS